MLSPSVTLGAYVGNRDRGSDPCADPVTAKWHPCHERLVGALIVLAGWIESNRPCRPRWVDPCMPDVDSGSLALFALDAAWVAAVCFIQAALPKPPTRSSTRVGRPDVADAPSR